MKTKSKQIGFRVYESEIELLRWVSAARGEDVSDFVRRAVRKELAYLGFVDDSEKKALGVD